MSTLLNLREVSIAYDQHPIIKELSFNLEEGAIGCLLGPSGCGKSTVLRAIAGFQPILNGSIHLAGQEVSRPGMDIPAEQRRVGMVFQDYALFPHMTVAQNVAFGLKQKKSVVNQQLIADMLRLVSLEDMADRFPHELSGGQQQRVALARALAPKPQLILLDEPFSNLDAELRKKLSLDVRAILKTLGISAILVTHDQQEAFAVSDYIGVIQHGTIQQWDTPYHLYHQPANRFVASFIGQGRFIKGQIVNSGEVDTEIGTLCGDSNYPWDAGSHVELLVRPDDIVYDPDSDLKAMVTGKTFAGTSTLYRFQLETGSIVEGLLPSHQDFKTGDRVPIRIDAEHLITFAR